MAIYNIIQRTVSWVVSNLIPWAIMTLLGICFQRNQWTIQIFCPIRGTERQDSGTSLEAWVWGQAWSWVTLTDNVNLPIFTDLWDGHKSGHFYELDNCPQLYKSHPFLIRAGDQGHNLVVFSVLISLKSIKNNIWYPFEYFNL